METPSSIRRVTRPQTSVESRKGKKCNGRTESSALHDITNDSPIVGLAGGSLAEKTPSTLVAKIGVQAKKTPGSGESLLRGQVKILLQKVEGDIELIGRPQAEVCSSFRVMLRHFRSPGQLLAPTPANTPLISALSDIDEECSSLNEVLTKQDDLKISPQVVEIDLHECVINRALQFDSPNKSEVKESSYLISSPEDNNSSVWSVEVHSSIKEYDDEEEEDYYEVEQNEEWFDVLCQGMSKMSVSGTGKMPEFTGEHKRFVYNSDNEIEEEEDLGMNTAVSPNILLLKGMPVPEGKHLRFQEDEED